MQLTSKGTTAVRRSRGALAAKRALDLTIAGLSLVLLLPLFALIALLIRKDSPGKVFFRQQRVGKDGRLFTCLKFRSMYQDADERVHQEAIRRLAAGMPLSSRHGASGKLTDDPRITRVGALLRRTSLDELPQLINVVRGEMSIVGPRPAIPYELEHYQQWQHQRHLVKPGLTGPWQVYGRGRTGLREMLDMDVDYATHWSLLLDLKLIGLTIPAVLRGGGAY
jgi:lipopolysaccharide/colanic/teichoic acid biosynthesis glycosyltransferase